MFKGLNKMTLGRKRKIIGNFNITKIREAQKILRFLYFLLADIVTYGNSQILFEKSSLVEVYRFDYIAALYCQSNLTARSTAYLEA